ncbi:MAG: urease accessory protein UreD [Hyphomicrobium sp.]
MFASAFQSSRPEIPSYVRARAEVRGVFARTGATTRLLDSFETGGLRLRTPNVAEGCEGVVLNTAGGLAGGDDAVMTFAVERKADVTITTQSAEKIYRADDRPATLAANLSVAAGGRLTWMPQETILFDGSRLKRALNIQLDERSSVIAAEMTVFGRVARGEQLTSGSVYDRWRVRRGGTLIFADDVWLDGEISEIMQKAAVGDGACAIATLVHVAPNAEKGLQAVRAIIDAAPAEGGASAWNGMLVVRLAARDPLGVRTAVAHVLRRLSRRTLPRVWSI